MMNAEHRVPASRFVLFWAIALGGAAFDLTTKTLIFAQVGPPGSSRSLVDNVLELRTSYNEGALWGFGRGVRYSPLIFAGLSIVAGAGICWWLFARGGARDLRYTMALGLIMAGAIGNCYDRLRYGHVRDFVYFHVDAIGFSCAIFNFADNMLVIGAIALLLLALKPEPSPSDDPRADANAIVANTD
jgi:signal peptidase II